MHAASFGRRAADPRFGWIAAVTPADARRFRVSDPALACTLSAAGASLLDDSPDVEIVPSGDVRGDARLAVVSFDVAAPDSRLRPVRVAQRIVRSAQMDFRARRARRTVRRRGYGHTTMLRWERGGPLPINETAGHREPLAHRFPLSALVLGHHAGAEATILDRAAAAAERSIGRPLGRASIAIGSSGVLVCVAEAGVLRVGLGPAAGAPRRTAPATGGRAPATGTG